mgnify:CR=1 FL=1
MSYSFSLTTFNPSGKLLQIEYALQTVQKGQTAVGVRATNGVVIACEKTVKTLLIEPKTHQKIATIAPNTCITYAGIGPDFRVLVAGARKVIDFFPCIQQYIVIRFG